jgi:hypothetical protein
VNANPRRARGAMLSVQALALLLEAFSNFFLFFLITLPDIFWKTRRCCSGRCRMMRCGSSRVGLTKSTKLSRFDRQLLGNGPHCLCKSKVSLNSRGARLARQLRLARPDRSSWPRRSIFSILGNARRDAGCLRPCPALSVNNGWASPPSSSCWHRRSILVGGMRRRGRARSDA